ncbi:MAG: ribosome assembly cofactor RimP [Bacteroidetes bacterium]|nr:ribosome assembly cofactor RimP [Bacteroidota bacterium]HET6244781.1 ribosome assembly cofactor RimP [Bacteroidia bacterium]
MITKEKIAPLVEEKLKGSDNYIVDIKVNTDNKIIIEIDNDNGLFIEDCINVSRYVEQNLDREDEDFELQVSSPGLSQPFKIKRQYFKNVGRKVEVVTLEGEKITGKLVAADELEIKLETEVKLKDEITKKRKTVNKIISLNYNNIKETKVVISFK